MSGKTSNFWSWWAIRRENWDAWLAFEAKGIRECCRLAFIAGRLSVRRPFKDPRYE